QVEWMEAHPDCVLCGHDVEIFDSSTGTTMSVHRPSVRSGRGPSAFVRLGGVVYGQSGMVRRDALPPDGFDERVPVVSDVKLWIDCLARSGGTFDCIDGVYARYRRHSRNVTQDGVTHIRQHLEALDLIEAQYPDLTADCA